MISKDKKTILFLSRFKKLKRLSNNFNRLDYRIILQDPSCLEIFRVISGMSIHNFSKSIGLPYSWVYNVEKKKYKIGINGAKNMATKILEMFNHNKYNFDIKDIKRNYCALNNLKINTNIAQYLDKLDSLDFYEFSKFFDKLRITTCNFRHLYQMILEDSRVIIIFRLILGISQKELAKKLNMSNMTIEELENGYRKVKLPNTAKNYASKIEKLLDKKTSTIEDLNRNWLAWKNTRKGVKGKNNNWKTIRYLKENKFIDYLTKIKQDTNNFSSIQPILFQKNPQLILIFRILLGLTQKDLERKIGLKGNYISNYESLKYKTLSMGMAELFSKYFTDNIKFEDLNKLSNEDIIEKLFEVKNSMFIHNNLANVSTPTKQEKKILSTIKNLKLENLGILMHHSINTNKGVINVDFLLTINDKPKRVIECAASYSNTKKFVYNLKRKIYDTDYRFTKIKLKYPNIKTVLILSVFEDALLKYNIKKLIRNETISINDIFINDELALLSKSIQEEGKL